MAKAAAAQELDKQLMEQQSVGGISNNVRLDFNDLAKTGKIVNNRSPMVSTDLNNVGDQTFATEQMIIDTEGNDEHSPLPQSQIKVNYLTKTHGELSAVYDDEENNISSHLQDSNRHRADSYD